MMENVHDYTKLFSPVNTDFKLAMLGCGGGWKLST